VKSQDIGNLYNEITKKDSIRINGSLGYNATLYKAWGTNNRREPYFWTINGNLNVAYKLIKIPISVQITKEQKNYTNPFQAPERQVGISPTFKGYTLHLGLRSMQFSEFTLSGAQFNGVGVDINNEKFPIKFKALYGRFAQAFQGDTSDFVTPELVLYDRWGWGTQVQFSKNDNEYGFSIFKATDDANSLDSLLATAFNAAPKENLVVGTTFRQKIGGSISVDGEYALSAYTRDTRSDDVTLDQYSYLNNIQVFTPRSSSDYKSAFYIQANLLIGMFTINSKYKRIAPDYKTMGAIFLTNNVEDVTLGLSWNMFKDKVSVTTNGGLQRDNLDKRQETETRRIIGSANLSYAITPKLNTSFSFANFSSRTQLAQFSQENVVTDQDSLFFLQETNNANFSINYSFGEKVAKSTALNLSYQEANDSEGNNSAFYNANFSQQVSFSKTGTQTTLNFNFSKNENAGTPSQVQLGPSFTLSQRLFKKKVRLSWTNTFQQSIQGGVKDSEFGNSRVTLGYNLKKHNFSSNIAFLNRKTFSSDSPPFREIRGGFNYNFTF